MESEEQKLVDEIFTLQKAQRDIEKKIEDIKSRIIDLSRKENKNILKGTYKNCILREYTKIIYPDNKDTLIGILKEKGLYDDLSMLNYSRISSRINKNELPQEITDQIKKEKDFRLVIVDRVIQ
ncbi:hypothetical protein COU57_03480 [Candidatus Pacearchaeota archaeon CG10_big_fil_rev_8_21_14_0_10_32_14]|nr:MAG: hypothetical protein COU57_03480 [Candidatus Pacearchaeota archaeon CG10_big_fil_rev_8_21_14_0_10_32_14]